MAYTTIDDPSAHFHTQLYTSNNGYNVSVVNDANAGNFKPDFLWVKSRSDIGGYAISHNLIDSSRGVTKTLFSDTTAAESTASQSNYDLQSFDTDGFTTGAPESTNSLGGGAVGKVAWQWKANGGTTTSVSESSYNAGGTYQKNETAGFSIVSYTGIDTVGEVTHGLTTQPQVVIVKRKDDTGAWATYHESAGITGTLFLDTTAAKGNTTAYFHTGWGSATKFPVGTNSKGQSSSGIKLETSFTLLIDDIVMLGGVTAEVITAPDPSIA